MKKWILFAAVCLLLTGCNTPAPQNTTSTPTESTGTYQEPEVDVDTFTEGTEEEQSIDISDLLGLGDDTSAPTKPDTEVTKTPSTPCAPDVPETTTSTVETTPETPTSAPSVPQPDSDGYQSVIVRP